MVAKILAFVVLYVGFGALWALQRRDTNNSVYELFRNKVLKAEEAVGPRRILLAGGSNVMWGYRSQLIEDTAHIPTYNLGLLHEAYDPANMRALIVRTVRPGDVVVYSSISFWNSRWIMAEEAKQLASTAGLSQDTWGLFHRYWSPMPERNLLRSLPDLVKRYVLRHPVPWDGVNEKGDNISCSHPVGLPGTGFAEPPKTEEFVETYHEFEQELQSRGARLVLSNPYILIHPNERELWLQKYQPFWNIVRKEFTVSWEALEHVLLDNREQFCDNAFHLTAQEAERRSLILGHFLKDPSIYAQME